MIDAYRKDKQVFTGEPIKELEREIDDRVYKLYKITKRERKVIERSAG